MVPRDCPAPALQFASAAIVVLAALLVGACAKTNPDDAPPPPLDPLVERGRDVFFNETFSGNGRTCATCHRLEDNFSISPQFIATLPADDPLFVAELDPNLAENFEKPLLMRSHALILENLDGFDDPANTFNLRGVPHTLALSASIESSQGPRLGWSGDGSPGDGSLRAFATGAVIQHFTKTTNRIPGVDFRLPTDDELDALDAFQLTLGRQEDLALPLALVNETALEGQALFLDNGKGKCNICHENGGANAAAPGGPSLGNANFDTGVENFPDPRGTDVPADNGFGRDGDGTFNTPSVVEAADTGPFFHNNVVATIEEAVDFYNSQAFNGSPAGQFLAGLDPTGAGIKLNDGEVRAIAVFLREINALENIRASLALLNTRSEQGIRQAGFETQDAIEVLSGAGLSAGAIKKLESAKRAIDHARKRTIAGSSYWVRRAINDLEAARSYLISA